MNSNDPLSLDQLQKDVHQALRAWKTVGGASDDLLASLWIVQEKRKEMANTSSPPLLRVATNEILEAALTKLKEYNSQGARVLNERFVNDNTIARVASQLNVSEHSVSRIQSEAIANLATIILEQEEAARATRMQQMKAALPPPTYTRLFGLTEAQAQLQEHLAAASPWIVAVVGIGGIGKTALVDSVVRQMIDRFIFEQVVWIRANPQTMHGRFHSPESIFDHLLSRLTQYFWPETGGEIVPEKRLLQVQQALRETPTLVIVDNLEEESNTDYLLSRLNKLTQPSKFLLTSRARPTHQTPIFHFAMDTLSYADAEALMRHHAAELGIGDLAESDGDEITAVYEVTGGNPLALKLIVSLLDVLPLSQALEGMVRGQEGKIEEMYRHIYWKTWQTLSPNARDLLQAMPLMAEIGAEPDYIKAAIQLDDNAFWPAVQELRSRSLLEVRGTLQQKRYGIHRLTETFLRTQIINWPDEEE